MATILVSDTNLTNIANAIREKNGETISYKVNEMANAIENISTSAGAAEDLSSELSTQNSLITTQETTIDNIITALEGKASGGSGGSKLLSGGNLAFNRSASDSISIAGSLKIINDFDGTKQYKINFCSDVLFNSYVPETYRAYSFNLNFSYEEADGIGCYLADVNPEDNRVMSTVLGYLGITGYGNVTKGSVIVMPSYGIAMVYFDTTDTTSVPDFQLGVWLEEV